MLEGTRIITFLDHLGRIRVNKLPGKAPRWEVQGETDSGLSFSCRCTTERQTRANAETAMRTLRGRLRAEGIV